MKKIYICGPTVYDHLHIGNARPLIVTDIYIRALIAKKTDFFYVSNITDIDDKIIVKAQKMATSESDIAKKYTKEYYKVMEMLNLEKPHAMPNVTNNIEGIINFIKTLVKKQWAYEVEGNVFFNIKKYSKYGCVSNYKIDELKFDNPNKLKKNPEDFTLWKNTEIGITWQSPWGHGRPGWHTECAFFINKHFDGKQIDVHAGGVDLKFPHHENENAQYYAINNIEITKSWKHFGHLSISGTKMSKSIGNIILIKDFVQSYNHNLLRYIFFSTSPTTPLNFTDEFLSNKIHELEKIKIFVKSVIQSFNLSSTVNDFSLDETLIEYASKFEFAKANFLIQKMIHKYNIDKTLSLGLKVINTLNALGFNYPIDIWDKKSIMLLNQWKELRSLKKYYEADKLRTQLKKNNLL